jgi:hypothetical protein
MSLYDTPRNNPGKSSGALIRRFVLIDDWDHGSQKCNAKHFGWTGGTSGGHQELDWQVGVWRHTDAEDADLPFPMLKGEVIWCIWRADALDSQGKPGRWEYIARYTATLLCKPNANIDPNDEGEVTIWGGTPGAEETTGIILPHVQNKTASTAEANVFSAIAWSGTGWYLLITTGDPIELQPFWLTEALVKNGAAGAKKLDFQFGAWVQGIDPMAVFDFIGLGPAGEEARGLAWMNPDSERYEIISLENGTGTYLWPFYLDEDVEHGDEDKDATLLEWDDTLPAWTVTGDAIQVSNPFNVGVGKQGQRGVAWLSPNSGRYEIIAFEQEAGTRLYMFELQEDLPDRGTASAKLLVWNAGGAAWNVSADPADIVPVFDDTGVGPAVAYKRGVSWIDPDSNRHQVVWVDKADAAGVRLYYVMEDIPRDGSGLGLIAEWDFGTGRYEVDDSIASPPTLTDPGQLGPIKEGWWVWVTESPESGNLEIVSVEKTYVARHIKFKLLEDMSKRASRKRAEATMFWDGPDPAIVFENGFFVFNHGPVDDNGRYVFEGKAGARGQAIWNEWDQQYEIVWVECGLGKVSEDSMGGGTDGGDDPPYDDGPNRNWGGGMTGTSGGPSASSSGDGGGSGGGSGGNSGGNDSGSAGANY